MSEQGKDAINKLNETFGTYSDIHNEDQDATVTARSEDDKIHKLDSDTDLSMTGPSTNDAPEQNSNVAVKPTAAQNVESDRIVTEDAASNPAEAEFKKFEDPRYLRDEFEEEEQDIPELLDAARDRVEDFVVQAKADPAATAKEAGKYILMAAGAIAILRGLFRRH